jgi:hypothetical protein
VTNDDVLNNIVGSTFWINSANIDFYQIQSDSNVPTKWTKIDGVLKSKYKNKIVKPINEYSINFGIKPELILENGYIVLRQYTHADIWVEKKGTKHLNALDKTWLRQFYPSDKILQNRDDCYLAQYKMYTQWIVDENIDIEIRSIPNSPFFVFPEIIKLNKIDIKLKHIYPKWIYFLIKKQDSMVKDGFFIIENNTPAFDIIIKDKDIIKMIVKEYSEK